jgi:hypothetical protein
MSLLFSIREMILFQLLDYGRITLILLLLKESKEEMLSLLVIASPAIITPQTDTNMPHIPLSPDLPSG